MATTFTYNIANLNRETADGYVFGGGYTVKANDGTYESGAYGNIEFERAYDVEPVEAVEAEAAVLDAEGNVVTPAVEAVEAVEGVLAALVPFADLTEATVVGWIKDKLGADKITEIETALQTQLNEQTAPTKATGVPW